MDVRCERCLTVYEFDDSQVGEGGVTVKCTQCGNLFKVKKRSVTGELPLGAMAARNAAYVPPAATPPPQIRSTQRGIPDTRKTEEDVGHAPTLPPVHRPAATTPAKANAIARPQPSPPRATAPQGVPRQPPPAPSDPRGQTLPRGTPAPPAPRQPAPPPQQRSPSRSRGDANDDLALTTTAPQNFEGPSSLGRPLAGEDPAFATTSPHPRSSGELGLSELLEEEPPPRRSRLPLYVGAGLLGVALIAGAVTMIPRGGGGGGKAKEAYDHGRALFLSDTDDAFRRSAELLQQAHGADESNPLVLAGLAEVHATWAWYLREDARELEAASGKAVESATRNMRRDAQAHLDDAKRYAGEALALAQQSPEGSLAMAEFLRIDGAPATEVERYLKRAQEKLASDPDTVFAAGALLLREGRPDEARTRLEQATALSSSARQKPLLRALYLLARLHSMAGRKDDAKRSLQQLLAANPEHERARSLLASLESEAVPTPAPVAAAAPVPGAPVAALPAAAPAPAPLAPVAAAPVAAPQKKSSDEPSGGDYSSLVAAGDKALEHGNEKKARDKYMQALVAQPRGVEALMGLGYCDLDGERFGAAVDRFKQVLSILPEHGEALIGLAEAYKVRDTAKAVEYYRRYLKVQPNGPKAQMAKNNIRDLEAHLPPPKKEEELPKPPSPDEPPP